MSDSAPDNVGHLEKNAEDSGGHLGDNVIHFVRLLRAAGLRAGPDKTLDALDAVMLCGLRQREDLHAALRAIVAKREDDLDLFDQAFAMFWRDPRLLEHMLGLLLPKVEGPGRVQPEGTPMASGLVARLFTRAP